MSRTKSPDPLDRMGVFKRLEDVPARYRLEQYERDYADRNVWQEFCENHEFQQGSSSHFRDEVDRVGANWADHMESVDRHHALAKPSHVEKWCEQLLSEKTGSTAYHYWVRIRRFYDWLRWHVDHPHVYNPVLMAAATERAAGRIWEVKLEKWRRVRGGDQHA